MTALVRFQEVAKHFGKTTALHEITFEVEQGEFFAMLGPSGSGKTTCLRLLAGFDYPDAGSILLEGRDISYLAPFQRNVNTVFQDYALFPHMNVIDNVAYGLMIAGMGKKERDKRASEMLDMVRLSGMAARKTTELSGGQKQRVALARALANKPKILLLDEPLGALDLKLREAMQAELKQLHQQLKLTFIYVTHDQGEALSMADRVAIFRSGRIEQIAAPQTLYDAPKTAFVAQFVGGANVIGNIAVRSENISLTHNPSSSGFEALPVKVLTKLYHGAYTRVECVVDDNHSLAGTLITAQLASSDQVLTSIQAGNKLYAAWQTVHGILLEAD